MAELKWLVKRGNYYYFLDAPVHATGVSLDKSMISFTSAGQTEQLTATVYPSGAIDKKVIWTSSNTSIATVSSTGLVSCVTPGNCTITATCDGVSTSCSVVVLKRVDILLVGGGGAGGAAGGGAGGVIQCNGYGLPGGKSFTVTIGNGGIRNGSNTKPGNGGNSTFNGLTAYGGGSGGYWGPSAAYCSACPGGSGGGGMMCNNRTGGAGCSGQGYKGGDGSASYGTGGGGGAGSAGNGGSTYCGGMGGIGIQSDITGTNTWYAGGGSGYDNYYGCNVGPSCGGAWSSYQNNCIAATNNPYYGGGGGAVNNDCCGRGHSGIFVIRYKTSCGYNMTGGNKYTCGDYTIHCFTSNGTLTVN